jgi:hypothetical protein
MSIGRLSNSVVSEIESPVCVAPRISPHTCFFLFYNLLYLLPLLLAFFYGYEEGGVGDVLNVDAQTMLLVCYVYLAGMLAFLIGSGVLPFLTWSIYGHIPKPIRFRCAEIGLPEWSAIGILVAIFLASKVALIPLGVYRAYAFDTDSMTGGAWSFSTFCSEAMILAALIALFSTSRYRLRAFFLISTLNAINLFHGTRLFFISSIMGLIMYLFLKRQIKFKVLLLYGPALASVLLLFAYLIFLKRSAVDTAGAFTAVKLLSPLIYESVFSQMSLLATLKMHGLWGEIGSIGLFKDVFLFTAPRFIATDKDSLISLSNYGWLSPLGAFNGYAQGILYFAMFFPAFYFVVGLVASWLYRKAESHPWWLILYAFFTEDFLLHLMRDGYLIPIKMLINTVELILLLMTWRYILMACRTGSRIRKRMNSAAGESLS